ncbi:LysR family transcriptional regulator [Variovorax sp. KK3]|uniref:LysR family transcriptional regulator n=1 Tax=Variovorax sp. KK3 TaxID=1855728 RepID=UPI0015C2E0C5|nr:LysR family transcriptional regulator [Variovorax sp. KK3]
MTTERPSSNAEPVRRLDESLIRSLNALLVDASVSRAAARLGIAQSALSRHLKALREIIGDELLVRVGNRMVLTERGEALAAPVRRILGDLSLLTAGGPEFSPTTSRQKFRLAAYDFLPKRFYAELIRRVSLASPESEITVRGLGDRFDHYRQLADGEIDMAISVWPELPPHLRATHLLSDEFVCVVRKGHPLAKGTLSLDAYLRAGHLSSLEHVAGQGSVMDALLSTLGVSVHTAVRTQFLSLAPAILASTDLVFSTGRLLAEQMAAESPLRVLPFPAAIKPLRYHLVWHERTHKHRALAWFRAELIEAARGLKRRQASGGS